MHRVAVLALDGVYPFELSIPKRIFGTATGSDGRPLYEVLTCSLDGGPVTTDADFTLAVEHGPELLATADTLVIPPFARCEEVDQDWFPEPLAAALARRRSGTRIVSICTSAYVLAAAGLLDGRPATTHWNQARHFRRTFPAVDLRPGVLFVDDGEVLTAAGVAAGIDLCLHMVRRDHGTEVANRVARLCIVARRRTGAVHRASGTRSGHGDHHRGTRLGPTAPARTAHTVHNGRAGAAERAHVQPALP